MKGLLVVAHGSRRRESNEEVHRITHRLQALENRYDRIECAFLELAVPSIPDGLRGLIRAGAHDILVMPYFLTAGRHVVSDVPAAIEPVRLQHPSVTFCIAPYLGSVPEIVDLLLIQATSPVTCR